MDNDISIDVVRNEVLRKIGRNVVLFQKLEGLMKYLLSRQDVSSPASRWQQAQEELRELVDKQTMGQLAGRLHRNLYEAAPDEQAAPQDVTEPWFSFSFRLEATSEFVDSRKVALATVVSDRNHLIHGLLPRWNPDSIESCRSLQTYLDEQCSSIRAEIDNMNGMVDALREHANVVQVFLQSEAGKKAFDLAWLQQSRIVLMLG